MLSAFVRSRPAAPGTELGSKFDAKTKPSWTSPGLQGGRKIEDGEHAVRFGREPEVLPSHAEVQREVRADPPVFGDERVHSPSSGSCAPSHRRSATNRKSGAPGCHPTDCGSRRSGSRTSCGSCDGGSALLCRSPSRWCRRSSPPTRIEWFPLAQRHRVADRVGRLQVVDAGAVGRRAEPDAAADVAVAVGCRAGSGRGPGRASGFSIPNSRVGEIGHRVAVVAVAEEPGAELVHHRGAEDVEVGERERPLIGRLLALEPGQRVAVGQRIAARLVREEELPAQPVGRASADDPRSS